MARLTPFGASPSRHGGEVGGSVGSAIVHTHMILVLAAAQSSPGGGVLSVLPLLLIFVAMYFLLLRPQRKRQKEARHCRTA